MDGIMWICRIKFASSDYSLQSYAAIVVRQSDLCCFRYCSTQDTWSNEGCVFDCAWPCTTFQRDEWWVIAWQENAILYHSFWWNYNSLSEVGNGPPYRILVGEVKKIITVYIDSVFLGHDFCWHCGTGRLKVHWRPESWRAIAVALLFHL